MSGLTQNKTSLSSKRILREGSWMVQLEAPGAPASSSLYHCPSAWLLHLKVPHGPTQLPGSSQDIHWGGGRREENQGNLLLLLRMRCFVFPPGIPSSCSWQTEQSPWTPHYPNSGSGVSQVAVWTGILPPKRGERMMGSHMVSVILWFFSHTCRSTSLMLEMHPVLVYIYLWDNFTLRHGILQFISYSLIESNT